MPDRIPHQTCLKKGKFALSGTSPDDAGSQSNVGGCFYPGKDEMEAEWNLVVGSWHGTPPLVWERQEYLDPAMASFGECILCLAL